MAKITLDNGMVIEGSVEEIKAMVEAFGVNEAEELKEPEPTYRLVSGRDARVGDFVKFTEESYEWITVGKYYEVVGFDEFGDAQVIDNDGDAFDICGETYEIYEKIAEAPAESSEPEPLKVGDYAKVVKLGGSTIAEVGEIVEILKTPYNEWDYNVRFVNERKDRPNRSKTEQFYEGEIVKATEEEVAEAKAEIERQLAEAKETERWTKIGREVNEYKVGDIVGTKYHGIFEIKTIDERREFPIRAIIDGREDGVKKNIITLITPVEARFDRE